MKFLFNTLLIVLVFVSCNSKKANNIVAQSSIIEKKVESVSITKNNNDLLMHAIEGRLNDVEKLVNEGAEVNFKNENGSTALMLAAYNGHTSIVEYLIKKGANVNVLDVNNRTALMYASSGPFVKTVTSLLNNGADVDLVDNVEKFSALMFAAAEGQTEVVDVLLKHGADKNLKDIDGESSLDFANANGHSSTAELLK